MWKKVLCQILIVAVLLQGCQAYYRKPSTLEEAIASESRVKMTRTNGKTVKFLRIEKTDTTYFGIKRFKGEKARIPLDPNDIASIRLINKPRSAIGSVLAVATVIGIAVIIFLAISYEDSDWEFEGPLFEP